MSELILDLPLILFKMDPFFLLNQNSLWEDLFKFMVVLTEVGDNRNSWYWKPQFSIVCINRSEKIKGKKKSFHSIVGSYINITHKTSFYVKTVTSIQLV